MRLSPRTRSFHGALVVLAAFALMCCHHQPSQQSTRSVTPEQVVARVDGEAITAEEVQDIARGAGISVREALSRAVDTHLLAREAARRGLVSPRERADVASHAAVQQLLQREVVDRVTVATLPADEVAEALAARRVELSPGELVRAIHFIVIAGPAQGAAARAAARAQAASFRARVVAVGGEHPTQADFAAVAAAMTTPQARAEALEPFDRSGYTARGRYLEDFAAQAFALSDDAPLSQVFESVYGAHVVLRLGSIAADPHPEAEVLGIVREGVKERDRAQALQALLHRLRQRIGAEVLDGVLAVVDPPRAIAVPSSDSLTRAP